MAIIFRLTDRGGIEPVGRRGLLARVRNGEVTVPVVMAIAASGGLRGWVCAPERGVPRIRRFYPRLVVWGISEQRNWLQGVVSQGRWSYNSLDDRNGCGTEK